MRDVEFDSLLRQDARPRLERRLVTLPGQLEVFETRGEVAVDLRHNAQASVHLAGPLKVWLDVEGLLKGPRRPVIRVEMEEHDALAVEEQNVVPRLVLRQ